MIDRSGGIRAYPLMDLFNDFIQSAALVDIPLKNRSFTWSNKRPQPSFSKIDRALTTPEWQIHFPVITLEMLVSDHAPLILTFKNNAPKPRCFKLESFWFKYEMPKQMVQLLWEGQPGRPQMCVQKFHENTEILHRALSAWHKENFYAMENRLIFCKSVILFFDRIEERRHLARYEFMLRCKVKEKAYELANNIEERWRQRSRCNWLQQGDKNTRFFHAKASGRNSTNRVLSIQHGENLITHPLQIQGVFLNHLRQQLGTSLPTLEFNPSDLYNQNMDLWSLDDPFTQAEVECAVKDLAKNKASGPDGIPNEFLQIYWPHLKGQIMAIVEGFYNNQVQLEEINKANVVMIPKKDSPDSVTDFRPISVINVIPKLLSKILANRLKNKMPNLISCNKPHSYKVGK
ncbi:uncharacterized protein LOC144547541 [Carex rostrata]